jgi:hypothetical protein
MHVRTHYASCSVIQDVHFFSRFAVFCNLPQITADYRNCGHN